jgi:hypothetical protein
MIAKDDIIEVSQEMRKHCQEVSGKVLVYEMREALVRLCGKLNLLRPELPVRAYSPRPPKPTPPKPIVYPDGELVYFVLDPYFEVIKIGYTANLSRRFREHQLDWGGGLQFLGAIKGDRKKENELHQQFSSFKCYKKVHREWFFAEKPLYDFINNSCDIKADE